MSNRKHLFTNLQNVPIIPLGMSCMLAYNLKKNGLMQENYGFEWLITPSISTFTKLINADFETFFSPSSTYFDSKTNSVFDSFYGVNSLHEYSKGEHYLEENEQVRRKFTTYLQRLKTRLIGNEPIILIRQERSKINTIEVQRCIDCIKQRFPLLKFSFFIIHHKKALPLAQIEGVHYVLYKPSLRFSFKKKMLTTLTFLPNNSWQATLDLKGRPVLKAHQVPLDYWISLIFMH